MVRASSESGVFLGRDSQGRGCVWGKTLYGNNSRSRAARSLCTGAPGEEDLGDVILDACPFSGPGMEIVLEVRRI